MVTAVAAFFVIALGLSVTKVVALPLAVVTAVIAAVVASWAAGRLAADGMRTDINRVVTRCVTWVLLLAGAAPLSLFFPAFPFSIFPVVVTYTVVVATTLAFRYRTSESSRTKAL